MPESESDREWLDRAMKRERLERPLDREWLGRTLPRDAFGVYWEDEGEVDGVRLYGLRHPGAISSPAIEELWPPSTELRDPHILWGTGWEVELRTLRVHQWPPPEAWEETLRLTLERLCEAGHAVTWFALEGDFVDPPDLFDPRYMGHSVYAALSACTGFLRNIRFGPEGPETLTLDVDQLLAVREAALPVWSEPNAS